MQDRTPSHPNELSLAGNPQLSLVVIAKNEEATIERCLETTIESAKHAVQTGRIKSFETILVDSASTDRTVELAAKHAQRVVRLQPEWFLSAAAGSYVGSSLAKGEIIAIVNADVISDQGWIAGVLRYISKGADAVAGVVLEQFVPADPLNRLLIRSSTADLGARLDSRFCESGNGGGASAGTLVVSSRALKAVGSYHPFLVAAEDFDLRHRLLGRGFLVSNVPVLQGTHFWASEGKPLELMDYLRTILRNSVGLGQVWRLRQDSTNIRGSARRAVVNARQASSLASGASCFLLPVLIVVAALTWPGTAALLSLGVALGVSIIIIRTVQTYEAHQPLSLKDKVFASLYLPALFSFVRLTGFTAGALRRPRLPQEYPWHA